MTASHEIEMVLDKFLGSFSFLELIEKQINFGRYL